MPSPFTYSTFRQDIADFADLGGPVYRTRNLLERLFPDVIWGMPDPDDNSPIHLTFDDGPAGNDTLRILDVLAKHDVQATFFIHGSKLIGQVDTVYKILDSGHRIGYHGLVHRGWWLRNADCRRLEMDPLQIPRVPNNPFENIDKPLLLRAPYGRIDWAALATVKDLGGVLVHWRLAMRDWVEGISSDALARLLYRYTYPGDIVVLHDGGPNAKQVAEALDRVIPVWKAKGMNLSGIDPFLAGDRRR